MQELTVDSETPDLPENAEERMVAPEPQLGEQFDQSLRPERLKDYIGQQEIKENLVVYIGAAKKRGHALDHVLLSGPPGLGKTTLANIFSREMEVPLRATSGPVIERQGDLAAILTNLEPGTILFIDEIHRLNRVVEEVLYGAMEDFTLDIIIGEGPGARTVKIDLPHFTLVGATTRAGLLTSPLRERFGIQFRLNFYNPEELKTIILRAASLLGIEIVEEASLELARRARGTPRIANRLLKRCRDFADMETSGVITLPLVKKSLDKMRIDIVGLDQMDRLILESIIEKFGGGPVGLSTLAASVSEEKDTIEDVYEPFLLLKGFLQRTPRGRMATERAYQHLGLSVPQRSQENLF
ncbi:MAG TPA: Holliday junction branch migration DNA helicase RuvB [Candidatus Lambdaproteobacteria bacterium]|jgi:Holliday junction DNA helicase RuvB|nr:Holliday junction branch migration DNA helicase RuvB [Deltaproteobacteria bacterium]HHZ78008.1 Holliday junction branch migration DNA helicase RuvB [Candidatus Lambdaproteobacteria bacterium]HIA57274.1 Holliday junction branch migration DNA helicase RuvB [Candidatus Lambdaproteobacteria bacterium]HIB46273.1 Holliday junction branch migration DNA helicase RuvB [Candidatus Lambdaproteobacteria bacterium]HIB93697.1 Holliday junction branch migration DNA helicase RuvB [Candidatus Lambdaproteobac